MRPEEIAARIHMLGGFCGMRDVKELAARALELAYGIRRADPRCASGGAKGPEEAR